MKKEKKNPNLVLMGKTIQKLREVRKMSLGQVAKNAGLSKGTLSKVENGTGNVTVLTLFAIAETLEVSPSELLVHEENS
jgi:transcriptional regulator with XRE-family HTH domain